MLRAIAGLNRCYSGKIILDGHDIACMKTEDMAKTLAVVTTERTRIANLRCKDVVAIGRAPYTNWIGRMQETDKEIVMQSLISVGMEAYANRTMDKMSDGECQRVMIARALAQDTPIILLDEPTSFLDMPNRYELVALLRRLVHDEKKCIMFSTHELDIALSMCDSIALLDTPNLSCLTASETVSYTHLTHTLPAPVQDGISSRGRGARCQDSRRQTRNSRYPRLCWYGRCCYTPLHF